jgi:hypothetical protein
VLHGFLARRCDKEFLRQYLESNPDTADSVSKPGLYLSAVSEVDLAVRLHEVGLLPEHNRKLFVITVSDYAIKGEDLYALEDADIRLVFRDDEFAALLDEVRTKLIPSLGRVRTDLAYDWMSADDPEQHMQPLLDSFDTLRRIFGDEPELRSMIDGEESLALEWLSENSSRKPERAPRHLAKLEIPEEPRGTRSIFDDVDA